MTDDQDDTDELWQAVLGLPPRQRATLVLRSHDGLSVKATAEVLGEPWCSQLALR